LEEDLLEEVSEEDVHKVAHLQDKEDSEDVHKGHLQE
jgi:hypothetical protein